MPNRVLLVVSVLVGAACTLLSCTARSPTAEPADEVVQTKSALNTVLVGAPFSDANGWNVPQNYSTIRYPDVNGDGASDVCGRGPAGVWCAVDNGTGGLVNEALWHSAFSDANGWNQAAYYRTIAFPDLNGDGRADLCGRGVAGILCALSNGNGFGTIGLWNGSFRDVDSWNQPQYYATISFPDLNGDGRADLCGRGIAGISCALSTGSSFGSLSLWNGSMSDAAGWTAAQYYSTIKFADLNNDQRADLCGRGAAGVSCALSTGSAFGNMTVWNPDFSDANGWSQAQYYSTIQLSDVNRDNRADLCARGVSGILCARSTGSTFSAPSLWNSSFGDADGWTAARYYSTIRISGGVLCGRGIDGIHCAFSNSVNAFDNQFLLSSNESDANGWTQAQYYSTIDLTRDYKIAERGALGIYSTYVYTKDQLSIASVSSLNSRRSALINKVWGNPTLNTTQGVDSDTVPATIDVQPLPPGVSVRRYRINMPTSGGIPIPGGPAAVQGLADHFIPAAPTSRLVILNPGHACNYVEIPYNDSQMVRELLAEGYAVLATYMPRYTPLDCASGDHDQLFDPAQTFRPANGAHPLIYFLDPVRRSLNYAIAKFGYTRVDMAGLSGGGWTTTLYAALDTRITTSLPIAGSEPFYARPPADAEQENDALRGNDFFGFSSGGNQIVTGYKDLYLLGAHGAGRRQVQVLNRNDDCCFGQSAHIGTAQTWEQLVRAYELEVRQRLQTLGTGSFRLEINEADDCMMTQNCGSGGPTRHEFSKNTRIGVILAELNGSDEALDATNNAFPFGRGANGHLLQNNGPPGAPWTDTGLSMVGTPAVLNNVVNPFDVFYRDPSNRIVHAKFDGTSWSATPDIWGTIISDPTAISWGAGRMDVVAVGGDYKVYHWWYNGSWHSELVPTGNTFAVGRPAVSSWGPNRLDIYFRGHDAVLYHVSSNGSAPHSFESTDRVIKNFPAASASGNTLWAFVSGTDNLLYQGQKLGGSPWTWSNVSSASGAGAVQIAGSPSVRNGTRDVYVRLALNQALGSYSSPIAATTWQFTNLGHGPFSSAPSSTNAGPFIVDAASGAWHRSSSGWVSLGGFIVR